MTTPTLIKTLKAPAAIGGRKAVTFGSADGEAAQASAATDALIGLAERIGSRDNDRVDVIVAGIGQGIAGGNITRGQVLTANASGDLIAASQATDRIIGMAMQSAVAGDFIDVLIAQG